jgi:hypothetical protein
MTAEPPKKMEINPFEFKFNMMGHLKLLNALRQCSMDGTPVKPTFSWPDDRDGHTHNSHRECYWIESTIPGMYIRLAQQQCETRYSGSLSRTTQIVSIDLTNEAPPGVRPKDFFLSSASGIDQPVMRESIWHMGFSVNSSMWVVLNPQGYVTSNHDKSLKIFEIVQTLQSVMMEVVIEVKHLVDDIRLPHLLQQ